MLLIQRITFLKIHFFLQNYGLTEAVYQDIYLL
ncbi:hypothetical protein PCC9214_00996 [Planktothrix tepida]|nr:hypothetical protein PCC9214_00996 [Planktothrix tepida]